MRSRIYSIIGVLSNTSDTERVYTMITNALSDFNASILSACFTEKSFSYL